MQGNGADRKKKGTLIGDDDTVDIGQTSCICHSEGIHKAKQLLSELKHSKPPPEL